MNESVAPASRQTLAVADHALLQEVARPDIVRNSAPHPDLLSDVLEGLHVEQSLFCLFEFGDPWAVEIGYMPLAMTWTVTEGTVWLIPREGKPVAFDAGDTILLPRGIVGEPFVFASSPEVPPSRIQDFWQEAELQGFKLGSYTAQRHLVRWGGSGKPTRVVSLAFGFADRTMSPLIATLPEVLFARASEMRQPLVDVALGMLMLDGQDTRPGWEALVRQITQTLSVIVIRTHALSITDRTSGWLAGLGDLHISRALATMHREPGRDWTLPALARIAGLSRTLFAERFYARVGQTPKRYLRTWRIHLAREALAESGIGVAALTHRLGYRSQAAFRKAFQDVTGMPPLQYRRHAATETIQSLVEEVEQVFGLYARLAADKTL